MHLIDENESNLHRRETSRLLEVIELDWFGSDFWIDPIAIGMEYLLCLDSYRYLKNLVT